MAILAHTLKAVDGNGWAGSAAVALGLGNNVANAAGAAAGDTVTVAVALAGDEIPPSYNVQVTPSQACFVSVSGKTQTGFTITLTPTVSTATIAAGTVGWLLVA